ncbi:MAG: hypothetical protein EOP64_01795 [Sphingomonas sp.]|nr:MAG: hypothetical protein EOP64_01795 [Sphingomonas sp.]
MFNSLGHLSDDLAEEREAMTKTSFDQIVDGIDQQLSYLHKEQWAHRYAELLDVICVATGEARERAKQTMEVHKKTQFRPETSRAALIAQAKLGYDTPQKEESSA